MYCSVVMIEELLRLVCSTYYNYYKELFKLFFLEFCRHSNTPDTVIMYLGLIEDYYSSIFESLLISTLIENILTTWEKLIPSTALMFT